MKKMLCLLCTGSLIHLAMGQSVIFSENLGQPAGNTIISWYTGWQNQVPIGFLSTSIPESEVRNTAASAGYTGASGDGNVFFTNTPGRNFIVRGINTSGYAAISLYLGHYKNSTAGNNELIIEVSTDGLTYSPLSYFRPTGTGTTGWVLLAPTGVIPSTPDLWIRFTQNSSSTQFRIDDIQLVGTPSALPVTFHNVAASSQAGVVKLQWSNLTETNLVHYAVERAGNGTGFTGLYIIPAQRNDGGEARYQWIDPSPLPGLNLYRIYSLEPDGKKIFSAVLRIDINLMAEPRIYPNPVVGKTFTLQLNLPAGLYPLSILNMAGRKIHSEWLNHNGGLISKTIELSSPARGIYFLVVGETVKRFIVNR